MDKPRRPPKKPYTAPRLRRYGDLRQLTRGGAQNRSEQNVAGPKTKTTGGA